MTARLHMRAFRRYSDSQSYLSGTDRLSSRGGFGEEYFGLASTYFEGRPPKSVNFHWRRFRVADMPLADSQEFELWLRDRWYEKDTLMEQYVTTGRFPPTPGTSGRQGFYNGFIETEVRTRYWFEFIRIFLILGVVGLLTNLFTKTWSNFSHVLHKT